MIMDHKLKLMVVDDSPLFRTWLIHSLSEDDRFQVVGYAVNALDAQERSRCCSRICLPWILKCQECQALIF